MRKLFYGICVFLSLLLLASETYPKEIPPVYVKHPFIRNHSLTLGPQIILTRSELNKSGIDTLSQALTTLGAIQLQDSVGTGSQTSVAMRGFGSNATSNTLVLLNGIPLSNPDLAGVNLNVIPLREIALIEIVSGTESVLYGDQAVAGIVNIKTRMKDRTLNLACTAGSYDLRECYLSFYNSYLNYPYYLSASKYHSDNYRDHNTYNQNMLSLGAKILRDPHEISIDGNFAKENMQYPGALTGLQVRKNRRQAQNHKNFFADSSNFFHLQYTLHLREDWEFTTDYALREMHGDGILFSPFTQRRKIHFLKPMFKGVYDKNQILAGGDFELDQYLLDSTFGLTDEHQQKLGLFGLVNYALREDLNVNLGLRGAMQKINLVSFNTTQNLQRTIASNLGLRYQPNPNWAMYLRRATSFRFPKADENAFAPKGVKSLRVQRGVSYETGVEWNDDCSQLKLGIFQLNLRDEIAFDPTQTPEQPFGSNRNLDPTKRIGATISEKIILFQKTTLNAQYNYVHARFQSGMYAGNRIPLVSETLARFGIDYAVREDTNFYLEGIFTGNQYPANDFANASQKIGGYMQYNLSFRYHLKQFEANLRLNNIFNKYYYLYTTLQANTVFYYPAPDRNITLILNYHA